MARTYRDTLEALADGSWPLLMRHHVAREAAHGNASSGRALALGDLLWERLSQRGKDRHRATVAEREVDGLRNTVQQLTDALLEAENGKGGGHG